MTRCIKKNDMENSIEILKQDILYHFKSGSSL